MSSRPSVQRQAWIDVSYTIDVPRGSDEHALDASVHGPVTLAEDDPLDNFARARVMQSLFVDGFDATH